MQRLAAAALALALLPVLPAAADPGVLAIRNARIHTVTGGTIERGTVVVRDGRIAAVGGPETEVPEGARVVDARGGVLIPGLVDTHSHLGVYSRPRVVANADGNEATGPLQPLVRAMDSLHPRDPGFRMAVAGGITTANVMPGSANVMGGQTAYVKCRGRTVEEMLIDPGDGPSGMKMANGENPKRVYSRRGKAPMTRMKIAALQRGIFLRARDYKERWDRYRSEGGKRPEHDPELEPVVEILEGKRTVHFHTHRADDILTAMRIADEFGFELVLHHVTEAWLVADEIAERGHPCSLIILDAPGGKPEAKNLRYETPAICEGAGIRFALHSDDPVTESRFFLRYGGLAMRGGLSAKSALEALTIRGAELLHLEDRLGSIEVGKDADLVLLSGEPFSAYTRVLRTWIEGETVFDRSRPEDLRYATGGHHVRARMPGHDYAPARGPEAVRPLPVEARGEPGRRFALYAARLFPVSSPSFAHGMVLVDDGKISHVGKWGERPVPDGWPVVVAACAMPGLVDAHGTAGLSGMLNLREDQDQDETTDPNQAELRALDGFNPREPLLRYLLRHGITLVHVAPGPKNPIAGQSGIFRTSAESTEDATIRFPAMLVFNLGEPPKRTYGERKAAPSTRMGTAALIRKALLRAKHPPPEDEREGPRPDPKRAVLERVLAGDLPALFVAHREDDIGTALRIVREFGLRGVLSQATEGFLVADRIREAGLPVIAAPTMQRAGDLQRFNTTLVNAAVMADAGVTVAISSGFEGYVPKTRVVLFEAGVAAANGLRHDRALRAVTLDAARILGIDDRFGSLDPGKSADIACFDGDPLEYATHVTHVFAAGRLAYAR